MNTAQLIAGCREGDARSIELLLEQHQARLFRLALSVLDDPAEADEAVQVALIAALQGLESYRSGSSLGTWLYSITLNVCRSRLRKRQVRDKLHQALQAVARLAGAAPAHPEESLVQRQAQAALWQALQSLGEKHRLPVVLRYYDNFSVAEIAEMLGVSEGTVSSRLFTARERLRMILTRKEVNHE
jgi:RNA polymerase sigma-70 factor (ECF subfamily)